VEDAGGIAGEHKGCQAIAESTDAVVEDEVTAGLAF
jgi:hypothetical protein